MVEKLILGSPAVSGAMNTIITTRAGKDLISALVSGFVLDSFSQAAKLTLAGS